MGPRFDRSRSGPYNKKLLRSPVFDVGPLPAGPRQSREGYATMTRQAPASSTLAWCILLVPWFGATPGAFGAEDTSATGDWLNVRESGASGSEFQTTAVTTGGTQRITVAEVGDFEAGQCITISKCNVHYPRAQLWQAMYDRRPLGDAVAVRGYDGSSGGWVGFVVDIESAAPPTFRWSADNGKTWRAQKVPIKRDWTALSCGVEIRFNDRTDWKPGAVVTFDARDGLVTVIEKTEGNVFVLRDPVPVTVKDAVVRHDDTAALQAAVDQAVQQKRNVYIPAGRYRLLNGLTVTAAESITVEGASAEHTVLDISQGLGAVVRLKGGKDVTIRNLRMLGHTTAEDGKPRVIHTSGGYSIWRMHMRPCNAVVTSGTERVLIENVHASRMACECFYAQGPGRRGTRVPSTSYTKSITYLRCSVTDCGFNAFNNNDMSESTSVLYCRVENINNCFWEGPGRFIRIIGNTVKDAGVIAVGNMFHRYEHLHELGIAQTIIADNVFEGISVNNAAINVRHCANQVVIRNNLFVNYGSNGILLDSADKSDFSDEKDWKHKASYPAGKVVVTGNILDLTHRSETPRRRTGITVSLNDAIISNNQIYVRGSPDPNAHGLRIAEPAVNVNVHDNLIRNCATGITTARVQASVGRVLGPTRFLRRGRALPLEWADGHLYRGWHVLWLTGSNAGTVAVIDTFEPETVSFRLTEALDMTEGDRFEVFQPRSLNWSICSNTIAGCRQPVVLDSHGSDTAVFRGNVVTRAQADGVTQAVVLSGRFKVIGNHITGFDEENSAALVLAPGRLGTACRNLYRNNIIERCSVAVTETAAGLWNEALTDGNLFINCHRDFASAREVGRIATPGALTSAQKPVLRAARVGEAVTLDGDVHEWPWQDKGRVVTLNHTPNGETVVSPQASACAAFDETSLYLAMRFAVPEGATLQPELHWGGDGVEVSFKNAAGKGVCPVFMLWGTVDGRFNSTTQGGATPEQAALLERNTGYAARSGNGIWTCEWQIPLKDVGLAPAAAPVLLFNMGFRSMAAGRWVAWVPTGSAIWHVDSGGELQFGP